MKLQCSAVITKQLIQQKWKTNRVTIRINSFLGKRCNFDLNKKINHFEMRNLDVSCQNDAWIL